MIGFIRPELRAAIWRWRDILIGGVLIVFGLWALLVPGGLLGAIGGFLALIGSGVTVTSLQRWRFRAPRDGPGTVDVDEGQVTYFGPLTGGAVALHEVSELALIRAGQTPHWRLTARDEQLFIPVDADGADALFDAFTTLPGLKVQRMLSALEDGSDTDTVIWRRHEADPRTLLE